MDFETVSPENFGKPLCGIGLNLIVRGVLKQCDFLAAVFDMKGHRVSADFAIVTYGDQVFQLHSDGTYHSNPLLGFLPENPPRGAGVEIRLYDTDPEDAIQRAIATGAVILQEPTDKPHDLRKAYILCENGYAWVPSTQL
ncbi:glyoxalase [Ascidiaceihabitans sp.]|nr:glyoxalase [Ascidiaceihabitans sp.]